MRNFTLDYARSELSALLQRNKNKQQLLFFSIMKKFICKVCGWVYDPEIGDPEGGIEPGTAFEDIPDDWVCPLCGVGKDDFEVTED